MICRTFSVFFLFGLIQTGGFGTSMMAAEMAPGTEATYRTTVRPFLEQHCYACHDADKSKAGLRIDTLAADISNSGDLDSWLEIMDAINLGEMPPEDEPRPDATVSFEVVEWIADQLRYAEKVAREAGGQIPMRRLNRDEFANTVRDLLRLDENKLGPLIEDLPGDGKAEGFDRLGVALFIDQTQIERTLAAAEKISELAIVDPANTPETLTTRFEAEVDPFSRDKSLNSMGIRPAEPLAKHRFDPKKRIPAGPPPHELKGDGVLFHDGKDGSRRDLGLGRIASVAVDELIQEDGYYRIRVRGGADPGSPGEPIALTVAYNFGTPQELMVEVPLTPSLDQPDIVETTMFLRRGTEDQRRRITLLYNDLPSYLRSTDENNRLYRGVREVISALRDARSGGDATEIARLETALNEAQARAKAWQGPLQEINPKYAKVEPPRVYLDWMDFEGPLRNDWPPRSHRELVFDGDERRDAAYAREIVENFLPRAYRRPVSDQEVDGVMELIASELQAGGDFYAALRLGLQRILTSPGFLLIQEPSAEGPRRLNDYELATRLSYFLWSTMPDDALLALAEAGELADPETLRAQVSRLLGDPKSREFVENFAGQWLNVRDFGSVMPDENYKDYDKDLEESSKREAYAFFEEILQQDLPITNFLDSKFAMVNERLARHYEIEGVEGAELRRVSLEPEHHRGGIFGMAGLMTYLADGTRTLPVRRAAWIVENLFNDPPPPPPPNAGEVQPNTEGENLTVRERLERHRNEATCASCHETLDPYGLGLENYDAIGRWRTRANGEGIRANKAPELDVSGELPGGRGFTSLEEFKAALLAEKDQFARALSERMLTYALGRSVGFSDRETLDAFAKTLKENDYRIQPLIQAIVASEVFQSK